MTDQLPNFSSTMIVELLREKGRLPLRTIAEELELPPRVVHDKLGELCTSGAVLKVAEGVYRAAGSNGPRKVLIVGGHEGHIRTTIAPRLERLGLHVEWIWPGYAQDHDRDKTDLPANCEVVILITDITSHAQANRAVLLAKKRGLPFVRGNRKWSYLLKQLIEQHIVSVQAAESLLREPEPEPPEPEPEPETAGELAPIEPPPPLPPTPPPPPPAPVRWSADGKPLAELIDVLKACVAELITGHRVTGITVDAEGHIAIKKEKTK